jgi:hypothetical protein
MRIPSRLESESDASVRATLAASVLRTRFRPKKGRKRRGDMSSTSIVPSRPRRSTSKTGAWRSSKTGRASACPAAPSTSPEPDRLLDASRTPADAPSGRYRSLAGEARNASAPLHWSLTSPRCGFMQWAMPPYLAWGQNCSISAWHFLAAHAAFASLSEQPTESSLMCACMHA